MLSGAISCRFCRASERDEVSGFLSGCNVRKWWKRFRRAGRRRNTETRTRGHLVWWFGQSVSDRLRRCHPIENSKKRPRIASSTRGRMSVTLEVIQVWSRSPLTARAILPLKFCTQFRVLFRWEATYNPAAGQTPKCSEYQLERGDLDHLCSESLGNFQR